MKYVYNCYPFLELLLSKKLYMHSLFSPSLLTCSRTFNTSLEKEWLGPYSNFKSKFWFLGFFLSGIGIMYVKIRQPWLVLLSLQNTNALGKDLEHLSSIWTIHKLVWLWMGTQCLDSIMLNLKLVYYGRYITLAFSHLSSWSNVKLKTWTFQETFESFIKRISFLLNEILLKILNVEIVICYCYC